MIALGLLATGEAALDLAEQLAVRLVNVRLRADAFDDVSELESRQEPRLVRALEMVAPGTAVREGIEHILHAHTGALICIGANPMAPAKGTATLTDAQAADLQGGRWYINIHTNANRGGEIRGQVLK